MKTREFDELIKRKVDQGEFEYSPSRWDELAEELDGKPGRRKSIMWLSLTAVATLSSIAASLAMVISIAAFLHQKTKPVAGNIQKTHVNNVVPAHAQSAPVYVAAQPAYMPVKQELTTNKPVKHTTNAIMPQAQGTTSSKTIIAPEPLLAGTFNQESEGAKAHKNNYRYYGLDSYVPEEKDRTNRTIISVAGGFNLGSSASGYSIGAAGKRMIGNKFYVEGDIAFVNNNTTQSNQYTTTTPFAASAKILSSGTGAINETHSATTTETIQNNYNMYYAQLTPSVGYNVFRGFSVGMGADMQRLIEADRPLATTESDGTVKQLPGFDFGAVGKMECSLSKNLKAGIFYRQGLNNTLTGSDKYIDRNYVQIQLKYTILKR